MSANSIGTHEFLGHQAVLLEYSIDLPPIAVHEGAIAAWYCQDSGRQFVATWGIEELPTPSQLLDAEADLKAFLNSVNCHP